MYLHGSHNKNYVYMWRLAHFFFFHFSLLHVSMALCVIFLISYHSFRTQFCLHFSCLSFALIFHINKCLHVSTYLAGHIILQRVGGEGEKDTKRKWWESRSAIKLRIPRLVFKQQKRRPDDDFGWCCETGITSGAGVEFLSMEIPFPRKKHEAVWGRKNYVFIFITPNKRKEIFISQHTWFADSRIPSSTCILSEPAAEEENPWMNHPRMVMEFYCYFYSTHMMGVCCVCSWIICWIMWFPMQDFEAFLQLVGERIYQQIRIMPA